MMDYAVKARGMRGPAAVATGDLLAARDQALGAAVDAAQQADRAESAADLLGNGVTSFFDNYAELTAAGLANGTVARVWRDETLGGAYTEYLIQGGSPVLKIADLLRRVLPTTMPEIGARMARGEAVSIAILGHSAVDGVNTTGWTAGQVGQLNNSPNAYPRKLQTALRDLFGNSAINVANYGFNGQTTGWAIQHFDAIVAPTPGLQMIGIHIGANDGAAGTTNIAPALRTLVRKVLAYGALPVMISEYPLYPVGYASGTQRNLNQCKAAVAAEFGIPYVDLDRVVTLFLERNNNVAGANPNVDWYSHIDDITLHYSDPVQAFAGSYIASLFAPHVVRVTDGLPSPVVEADPRAGRIGDGRFTVPVPVIARGGGVHTYNNPPLSAALETVWIWNERPDALLVHRTLDNGVDSDGSPPNPAPADSGRIQIVDYNTGATIVDRPWDNAGVQRTQLYRTSDRPNVIGRLPYGLAKATLLSPSTAVDRAIPGNLEVRTAQALEPPAAAIGQLEYGVEGTLGQTNALLRTGAIYARATGPGTGLALTPSGEAPDFSNIMYAGKAGQTVSLLLDLRIDPGMGLGILAGNGFGAGNNYFRIGVVALRRADGILLSHYALRSDGTFFLEPIADPLIANGGWALGATFGRLRLDFGRDNASPALQRFTAYSDWDGATQLGSVTAGQNATGSGSSVPWAGYLGDIIYESTSFGAAGTYGNGGVLDVRSAVIVHRQA